MIDKGSVDAGNLYIVSSPSGGGKTTLVKRLLETFGELGVSISYTTRHPRSGEVDGEDYCFIDDATFDRMAADGLFAEFATVHGNRYGTTRQVVDEEVAAGRDLLFDVDYQGARALKASYPEAVAILILPPSMQELERRLVARAKDSEETIRRRLANAATEIAAYQAFDYIIINDDLELAFGDLTAIIRAERCSQARMARHARRLLGQGS